MFVLRYICDKNYLCFSFLDILYTIKIKSLMIMSLYVSKVNTFLISGLCSYVIVCGFSPFFKKQIEKCIYFVGKQVALELVIKILLNQNTTTASIAHS